MGVNRRTGACREFGQRPTRHGRNLSDVLDVGVLGNPLHGLKIVYAATGRSADCRTFLERLNRLELRGLTTLESLCGSNISC